MVCSECGTRNPSGTRFCEECGSPLRAQCPSCGQHIRPDARFCGNCGARTGATAGAEGSAATATARASDVGAGTHPSARLTATAAGAERRLVSVLFADLVGFTTYAEDRDPEEVRETLTRYFELGRDIIESYGGNVEKFIGDAVMAVWGTPVAHEDDAERAVRAALDLTTSVGTLGPGIRARAGVLTGEAAVTLGAQGQGMVAGDLVNTASRLQAAAAPGTVLVGQATMRAASAAIAFEPAGEHVLKGKSTPVDAFQALRVIAQRGGAGRSDLPEPPFVGRVDEMRLLKELLGATGRDHRTRLVSVTGPAGIGKSRLAWELEKYIDGVVESIYWHRGRSPAYGEGVSFWALGEMVRSRARLAESDDEATTRRGISAVVAEYVADEHERAWIEPALLALLGIEPPPQGGREMLFAAWRTFFERIAARGTTVLVFEDLHWADPGLLDFIEHVLEWSRGAPILILGLARPELLERREGWGSGWRNFNALALDPLSDASMREVLGGMAPGLPEAVVSAVVARADGIPLYAVEMMRMLVADDRLRAIDGVYRPTAELGELTVPESLRSLIASRLDALDPVDRSLLSDASVVGQSFTLASLAAVSGVEPTELEPRLRSLVRRELLTLDIDPRSPERGQYAFVQGLIAEVAYATLARRDRRDRHLAAARYFEGVGDDELAGILASHYVSAHEASAAGPEADAVAAQARIALQGAADRAAALGGHDQAVSYLGQALQITADPRERAALQERRSEEARVGGRYEVAEIAAREAVAICVSLGDRVGVARARGALGIVLINQSRIPEATAETEQALAGLPDDAPVEVRAQLQARLARAYYRGLNDELAVETAEQALKLSEPRLLDGVTAEALIARGTALTSVFRSHEGRALLRAGADLALATGDVASALRAINNLGNVLGESDVAGALAAVREGQQLARRVGSLENLVWLTVNLTFQLRIAGEPLGPVLAELDDLLARDLSAADRLYVLHTRLIEAYELGDDPGDMRAEVARLVAGVDDPQVRWYDALVHAWRALVSGDFMDAGLQLMALAREFPDRSRADIGTICLAWAGDVAAARVAVDELFRSPQAGAATAALRTIARATVLALEGQTVEATQLFRDGMRGSRAVGDVFGSALAGLSMLRMLDVSVPEARAAGEEALRVFEHGGARPFAAMTRELLATGEAAVEAGAVAGAGVAGPERTATTTTH